MTYDEFFQTAMAGQKFAPRDWQRDLAECRDPRNRLIRIPTGMGKTAGVLAAWIWNAVCEQAGSSRDLWPRRLVWCLPMRVLVEQTADVARGLVRQAGMESRVGVHCLMGGVETDEWHLHPEKPAILVGTQDMLLSRALNRGYASGRARWPHEFGLLNHDCLWVMDEVQLMDVGLATSAQLQAYRDEESSKGLRPCFTWWMSATLQPQWLRSVDTQSSFEDWCRDPCVIASAERVGGLWNIPKSLAKEAIEAKDTGAFAGRILDEHAAIEAGEFGRVTLVVCNTVERACQTHAALRKAGRAENLELVHSRFRSHERSGWSRFLNRDACGRDADRIIVATQVIEAGVDLSAGCLVTELAPWPSLVQRFGRCARYGGQGRMLVVDRGQDDKSARPYDAAELAAAWDAMQRLDDAGIRSLEEFEAGLDDEQREQLYPYAPDHLLMRDEFVELFDTTPDLTGADLDISRFIRSGDERDLQVFWIDVPKGGVPDQRRQPRRDELCSVPFLAAQDWLCGKKSVAERTWIRDWLDGEWVPARRDMLLPGRVICVAAERGGYSPEAGFAPDSKVPVPPVLPDPEIASDSVGTASGRSDSQQDDESLSRNDWKTIAFHSQEVAEEAAAICSALGLPGDVSELLQFAARWHDLGKSHPAFQGMLRDRENEQRPERSDLAKGPDAAWETDRQKFYTYLDGSDQRRGFRHELASALAMFSVLKSFAPRHPALLGPWVELLESLSRPVPDAAAEVSHPEIQRLIDCSADEFDLLVYLVASHHGKVRVALHAAPADQDYQPTDGDQQGLPIRGVRTGDLLPSIALTPDGPPLPELPLTLEPAALGLSFDTGASWRERTLKLIERLGPTRLGFLEAVLRSADVRASQRTTSDQAFEAATVTT